MAAETHGFDLIPAVALLGAGVIAVPIFHSIGLGSVLGYLVAGIAIGPFGIRLFQDPQAILNVAELGVVMLLFIIGLELKPSRLWSLRRDIFGLGLAQVLLSGSLVMIAAIAAGLRFNVAVVAAMGLALSSTAVVLGLLDSTMAAVLNAAVIVSMGMTPLAPFAIRRLLPADRESFEGVEMADGLSGTALLIGFGRFGQVVSQPLLARGIDVSIIDNDTEMIRAAARFGFKIFYGDGTRLDVLRAAGAGSAKIIAVCVDRREAADRIVELIRAEFPIARLLVRAYDRGHTLDLINAGVEYQVRETFESAIAFGTAALRELGVSQEDVVELIAAVRARDAERLEIQQAEGIFASGGMLKTQPTPTPLTPPKRVSRPLSEETAVVAAEQDGVADIASSDR